MANHPIECATCGAIVGVHDVGDTVHLDALADRIVGGEDSNYDEHVRHLSETERARLAAELRRRAGVCLEASREIGEAAR